MMIDDGEEETTDRYEQIYQQKNTTVQRETKPRAKQKIYDN